MNEIHARRARSPAEPLSRSVIPSPRPRGRRGTGSTRRRGSRRSQLVDPVGVCCVVVAQPGLVLERTDGAEEAHRASWLAGLQEEQWGTAQLRGSQRLIEIRGML
jgi:hypothetical protein